MSVGIVTFEAESDREQKDAARAQSFAAAAVSAIAQLSRAPSAAPRLSAAQSALQLFEIGQRHFTPQQQSPSEFKVAGPEPSDLHDTLTDVTISTLSARYPVVLPDSALVQLGQAAVAGVSDVGADVAAAWHQVVDCMAPAIMRVATSASRSTLPAFLLLHEVRLCLRLGHSCCSVARATRGLLSAGWCEGAL